MFKYMSERVAPLFAESLKVRFTQPFDLNDPFEFRPFMNFEGTAEEAREVIEPKFDEIFSSVDGALSMIEKLHATDPNYPKLAAPIEVLRKLLPNNPAFEEEFVREMQKSKAQIFDIKRMAAQWEASWEKFRQSFGQALGIFSLTEDQESVLMWSHYASQHFGIAVEFDEKHPWFDQKITPSDDIRHLVQVSYVQNPHPKTWREVRGTDMLYTKDAQWSYEREWRIIRPVKDGAEIAPAITCFDVPPDAILSITFGSRTTPTLEKEIRSLVSANPALKRVRFKRAKLSGAGKIEIVDAA